MKSMILFATHCMFATTLIVSVVQNDRVANAFTGFTRPTFQVNRSSLKYLYRPVRGTGSCRSACTKVVLSLNNDGSGVDNEIQSSIPPELLETIAAAEAATPGAAGRKVRIIAYVCGALVCLALTALCAAYSATEGSTEAGPKPDFLLATSSIPLVSAGFVGTSVYTLLTGGLGTMVCSILSSR